MLVLALPINICHSWAQKAPPGLPNLSLSLREMRLDTRSISLLRSRLLETPKPLCIATGAASIAIDCQETSKPGALSFSS
ncbi:hypothetical protein BDV40DRAFT_252953 [Aspergillus tamarii]|uniref:Uncharacterized protein n=1 Tax=Aspergillus tamarii TaxID=41984 RepID=A0A5N6VC39_ASPTM|nr:hypothetical protein BDV40DRAFT_252953 [Aspergillus tamarii]